MMTVNGGYQKVYTVTSDSTMDGALEKSQRLQPSLDRLVREKVVHDYSSCSQFVVSRLNRSAVWDCGRALLNATRAN